MALRALHLNSNGNRDGVPAHGDARSDDSSIVLKPVERPTVNAVYGIKQRLMGDWLYMRRSKQVCPTSLPSLESHAVTRQMTGGELLQLELLEAVTFGAGYLDSARKTAYLFGACCEGVRPETRTEASQAMRDLSDLGTASN